MPADRHQILVVGEGDRVVDGESHWKDFVQVLIDDHRAALTLAVEILRQVEAHQFQEGDKSAVRFSLTGSLEPSE